MWKWIHTTSYHRTCIHFVTINSHCFVSLITDSANETKKYRVKVSDTDARIHSHTRFYTLIFCFNFSAPSHRYPSHNWILKLSFECAHMTILNAYQIRICPVCHGKYRLKKSSIFDHIWFLCNFETCGPAPVLWKNRPNKPVHINSWNFFPSPAELRVHTNWIIKQDNYETWSIRQQNCNCAQKVDRAAIPNWFIYTEYLCSVV